MWLVIAHPSHFTKLSSGPDWSLCQPILVPRPYVWHPCETMVEVMDLLSYAFTNYQNMSGHKLNPFVHLHKPDFFTLPCLHNTHCAALALSRACCLIATVCTKWIQLYKIFCETVSKFLMPCCSVAPRTDLPALMVRIKRWRFRFSSSQTTANSLCLVS